MLNLANQRGESVSGHLVNRNVNLPKAPSKDMQIITP